MTSSHNVSFEILECLAFSYIYSAGCDVSLKSQLASSSIAEFNTTILFFSFSSDDIRTGGGMDVLYIKILLYIIVISKYLPVLLKDERQRWIEYCHNDYTKCPNCFVGNNTLSGETFLENIRIESRFDLEVSSLFGNRKIQYGTSGQQKVILKYLIDDESFDALTSKCCDGRVDCKDFWTKKSNSEMLRTELLRNFQTKDSVAGFQICPSDSVPRFMEVFSQQNVYEWLLLNLNVEPLIIDRLKRSNFPVPKLYGLCGFVTLQSNNGLPLYSFFDQSFAVRLLIAKNLLNAALKFSFGLEGFRYVYIKFIKFVASNSIHEKHNE